MTDIRQHYRKPDTHPYPPETNHLLGEVTRLLEKCGMDDPVARIYITTDPLEGLSMFLVIFTISYLPKLEYEACFSTLIRKKSSYPLDGFVLIMGIVTVLKQFHPLYTTQYLQMVGQFLRISIDTLYKANSQRFTGGGDTELPAEVLTLVRYLRILCTVLKIPKELVPAVVPSHVVHSVK
jgi:hypothetical protein